jgi:hypothetical protein
MDEREDDDEIDEEMSGRIWGSAEIYQNERTDERTKRICPLRTETPVGFGEFCVGKKTEADGGPLARIRGGW